MSLKKECKTAILTVLKNDGMPPIIDKTYGSIWDTFAKTQPTQLTTSTNPAGADTDLWGNLERTIVKFGVSPGHAAKVIAILKKKFGETPSLPDIKAMMA